MQDLAEVNNFPPQSWQWGSGTILILIPPNQKNSGKKVVILGNPPNCTMGMGNKWDLLMRRNFPEVIADFEAYLLRLLSSSLLMRLAARGGYCALPHTCIHSQKQHSLLPFPTLLPPQKGTQPGWKRSLEFLAGKLSSLCSKWAVAPSFCCLFFSLGWVRCLVIHFYLDSFRHFHLGLRWGLGECQAALTLSSCIPWVLRGWRLLMTYSVHYCIHPLLSYVLHTRASEAFRVHLQTWDTVQKWCW